MTKSRKKLWLQGTIPGDTPQFLQDLCPVLARIDGEKFRTMELFSISRAAGIDAFRCAELVDLPGGIIRQQILSNCRNGQNPPGVIH